MSEEAGQEYFSDGISEDIITALSKLRWFYVIARNSSFVYKGKAVPIKQVGEELGVGYVLEGSVRKEGNRVRITRSSSMSRQGIHIWSEHYDRSLADVFAVQDDITQSIVAAIEPQLYAAESFRAERKAPGSMDAWDLVMRALSHYWRVTRQDNVVAQALLEKAISIDPDYGQALGLLAASHMFGVHMGWTTPEEALPVGERAALAAIRADSEDPWAHYALGSVYLFTRSFDDCLAEFELATRLNPSFSPARGYHGVALAYCGRWEEGDAAARQALRLSPRDPFAAVYCGVVAYCQFVGRNYEEAMRMSREALRRRSDFVGAHRVLAAAAGMAGQQSVAEAALRELHRVATERFAGLDREAYSVQARCRTRALSRWIAPCGPAIAQRWGWTGRLLTYSIDQITASIRSVSSTCFRMRASRSAHCCWPDLVADQVLADFDAGVDQAAHLAMHGDGVVGRIAHRIGFVVADHQIALGAQLLQQQRRQRAVAVIERADVPGPRDAGIDRREAVQRHQHRRLSAMQPRLDDLVDAAVIGIEDFAAAHLRGLRRQSLIAGNGRWPR